MSPTKIVLGIFGALILLALIASTFGRMPMNFRSSLIQRGTLISPMDVTTSSTRPAADLPVIWERMPEFQGITRWWNTPDNRPLSTADLKGKVVLIDFWTYSCINCIRTYPFIKLMQQKYADKGLVVVGVHTPEFAFEGDAKNVDAEVRKNDFQHIIALDPARATWDAYTNVYWPAAYFFDREGRLRHVHFGEGEYDQSEQVIRNLLAEGGAQDLGPMAEKMPTPDFTNIRTQETYFGLDRGGAFMGTAGKRGEKTMYPLSQKTVDPNRWSVQGTWTFEREYVVNQSTNAIFRFNVQAGKLHLVLSSDDGAEKSVEIFVDGMRVNDLTIQAPTLYNIADFPDAGRHTVEVRIKEKGVRFYSATFS